MVASSDAVAEGAPPSESPHPLESVGSGGARDWGGIAERGSLLGIRFTLWWYGIFGRLLTLPVVFLVAAYFFLTDAAGRRASLAYLRRVYATERGREAFSRVPGLRESFRHYRTFALAIVDRVSVWFDAPDQFDFETEGAEVFERYMAEGRGVLILSAHLGNFDALRRLAERTGAVVNVLMYTDNAKRINRLLDELSPEVRDRMILVDPTSIQSVFAVRERLSRGEHVAILADRNELGSHSRSVPVKILGDEVRLPRAPVELAGLLGCPVLVLFALRDGAGRYRVYIETLAERVKYSRRERDAAAAELMGAFAQRMEFYCSGDPYQWFNFYDYWGDAARSTRAAT